MFEVFLAEFLVLKDIHETFGFREFRLTIRKRKGLWLFCFVFFCGKQPFLPQRHLLSHKSSTVSKSHFTEVVSASASYSPIPVIDCTPLQSSFFSYSTSIYIFPVSAHNSDYLHFSPDHHSVSWVCFCLSFLPAANHLSHLIFSGLGAVYFPALCSSSYKQHGHHPPFCLYHCCSANSDNSKGSLYMHLIFSIWDQQLPNSTRRAHVAEERTCAHWRIQVPK